MYIDENAVFSVCGVSLNSSNIVLRGQLYQVFPDPNNIKGALVQKRFMTLPAEVPSDVGQVYLFRIVEYKDGRHPSLNSEKYMFVGRDGLLYPTTFCRIDLAYRSLYVKRVEVNFINAHDAADLFLRWEEAMPRLLRFEHLFWTSDGRFDTFKWKVLTRDLMNGQTESERIVKAWNHFASYSNGSPELVAWKQSHPMGDSLRQPTVSPVMMPLAPVQPQYQCTPVQRCPNGMKKGPSNYRRPKRNQWGQMPYMDYGWGGNPTMPQQQTMPPQYGWLQQSAMNPYMQAYTPQQQSVCPSQTAPNLIMQDEGNGFRG